MKLFIILLGILLMVSGIYWLINPEIVAGLIEGNLEKSSLYLAAIIGRLVIGILFLISANESKFPITIKVLGSMALIAAIVFIFIGHEGFTDFISSIMSIFKSYGRIGGLVCLIFGSFIIYAFSAGRKENEL